MTISDLIIWIEGHPTTVEIIKWIILLLLAWGAGLFRVLRKYTRRSQLEVIDTASLCFIEEMGEYEGNPNATRVAYLINISVKNPSSEKVVIESFSLSYLTKRFFKAHS